MFYLMTHSTQFYLWLYGVTHMVKDHSDSERGNLHDAIKTLNYVIGYHGIKGLKSTSGPKLLQMTIYIYIIFRRYE